MMITDEDARALVKTLRDISARNASERDDYAGEYWGGQSDGRASAYKFAADWLEAIIHEEAENAQVF